jgi:hypothetical protein
MTRAFTLFAGLACLVACSGTQQPTTAITAKSIHVRQYDGGYLIGEWETKGIVYSAINGAKYRFEDASSHQTIEISGTVQIVIQ